MDDTRVPTQGRVCKYGDSIGLDLLCTMEVVGTMKTLVVIQQEVGEWSLRNFGSQRSKVVQMLHLHSMAPLMGLAEEFGELMVAEEKKDIADAIGDIFIYLCDYLSREWVVLTSLTSLPSIITADWRRRDALVAMAFSIGQIFRCTLKRHQGIRGFHDTKHYQTYRNHCCAHLLDSLDRYANENLGIGLCEVANTVWDHVVSKRNWKEDPNAGQSSDT